MLIKVCLIKKVNTAAVNAEPIINRILFRRFFSRFSLEISSSKKYFSIKVIEAPIRLGATNAKILAIIVIKTPITILFRYLKKNLFRYLSSFIEVFKYTF